MAPLADEGNATDGYSPGSDGNATQKIFSDESFPTSPSDRPPLWKFRTMTDSQSWSCSVTKNGVIVLEVVHNDIMNVTADMMLWMYENLQNGRSRHPFTGDVYPNFLLMHPRDHVRHTASRPISEDSARRRGGGAGAAGDGGEGPPETYWIEFPLTGCYWREDAVEPWVCPSWPSANPGVTKQTPASVWQGYSQVNGTSLLKSFHKGKIKFKVRGCNEKGACASVIRTEQKWKEIKVKDKNGGGGGGGGSRRSSVPGIELRTRQEIGLNMGLARKRINPRIVRNWRNGENSTRKCQRAALHFIEEYGALEHWLPFAYNDAMGTEVNASASNGNGTWTNGTVTNGTVTNGTNGNITGIVD